MANTYIKEHQFVYGYSDGVLSGKFDFTTGTFYGKTGKAVTGLPQIFSYPINGHFSAYSEPVWLYGYSGIIDNPLLCAVNLYFRASKIFGNPTILTNYRKGLEKLISVNYPIGNCDIVRRLGQGDYNNIFNKKLFDYAKKTLEENSAPHAYRAMSNIETTAIKMEEVALKNTIGNKYPLEDFASDYSKNAITSAINEYADSVLLAKRYNEDVTYTNREKYLKEKLNWIYSEAKIAEHESIFVNGRFYNSTFGSEFLAEFFDCLKTINKLNEDNSSIKTVRNLASEYFKAKEVARLTQDRLQDKAIEAYNNQPWLYYEDDRVIIKPLLTQTEFFDESNQQHNCVARMYLDQVKSGRTHIVGIRLKADLSKTYITCEVNNVGDIIQFLLAYNQRPSLAEDLALRSAYEHHLKVNFPDKTKF